MRVVKECRGTAKPDAELPPAMAARQSAADNPVCEPLARSQNAGLYAAGCTVSCNMEILASKAPLQSYCPCRDAQRKNDGSWDQAGQQDPQGVVMILLVGQ